MKGDPAASSVSYPAQVTRAASHLVVGTVGQGLVAPMSASDPSTWSGKIRGVTLAPMTAGVGVLVSKMDRIDDPAWANWTVGASVFLGEDGAMQRVGFVTSPGEVTVALGDPLLLPETIVVGDGVFFAIAAGRGLTPDTVRQDQFRDALESVVGAGSVDVLIGRILPGHNPVRNAWETPFVPPGGVLATYVASPQGLDLSSAAMSAIFAAARITNSL